MIERVLSDRPAHIGGIRALEVFLAIEPEFGDAIDVARIIGDHVEDRTA